MFSLSCAIHVLKFYQSINKLINKSTKYSCSSKARLNNVNLGLVRETGIDYEHPPASVSTLCNVRPPPWPPPTPAPSICDPAPPSSEVNGLNARKANMKTHSVMRDRSSMPPNVEVISIGSGQTMDI